MEFIVTTFLLIYTCACILHAVAQIGLATITNEWTNSDKAFSFFVNILTAAIFILAYTQHIVVSNYQTYTNYLLLFIIIHHTARAFYNLRSYPNGRTYPMLEIGTNMILYIATTLGMMMWVL